MVIFKEKEYSSKASSIRKVARYIKKYPLLPISAASLGIATANYAYNKKKAREDLNLQKKQLNAMKELTEALTDTTTALEKEEKARKKELSEKKDKQKKKTKIPSFKSKKDRKK